MAKNSNKEVIDELTLNQAFEKLDTLTEKLSADDNTLEDAFLLYQQGMELLKVCNDKIDAVEKKMLVLDENGEKHEFESN